MTIARGQGKTMLAFLVKTAYNGYNDIDNHY
jgi:hypothetical protein